MKAIHRGNGSFWNRIINWANTFIVAAFFFCTTSGLAGNSTNTLWLSLSGASNGWLTLTLNGTQPGSNYTLLSQATLTASNWNAAGLVTGAQNQSWTAVQMPLTGTVWFVRAQYYQSSGGGGTNSGGGGTNSGTSGYGTNLWLSSGGMANGVASLAVANSAQDILYEIQGKTNLLQPDWISYGFVDGSELTNWTLASLPVSQQGNLFLRIRSWVDSNNSGIPDWWWLQYFGQITNVNANASAAGDGYSNMQKFQMGVNPISYYNPNTPPNFFGYVAGSNAFIMWSPAPGPVLNYAIQRGILNTNTGNYIYTQFLVSSNATWFEDVGAITNANAQNNIYNLEAVYPGGSLSGTNTWQVYWYANYSSYGPPYGPPTPGNVYAYVDSTGTNVLVSWTPAQGPATNCLIERGTNHIGYYTYIYSPIAQVGTNATSFEDVGALTNANNWVEAYAVAAVYPGGGLSYAVPSYSEDSFSPISLGSNTNGPAAPANFFGYTDWIYYPWDGGTNVYLIWSPSPGAVSYIIYAANWDNSIGSARYQPIGRVSSTSFKLAGGTDGNGNYTYSMFAIVAVYADGSLSQSATCNAGNSGPAPAMLAAYVDATGTNVTLLWSSVPGATGYSVQRSDSGGYNYYKIAETDPSTTSFVDVDEVDNANLYGSGIDAVSYQVQAFLPNGGYSGNAVAWVSNTPPAPSGLSATVDATGTNVMLSWAPAVGAVSNYIILRGTYNPATGTYSYSQIATVSAGTTSYEDVGAATGGNSNNNTYEVIADYGGGQWSAPDSSPLYQSSSPLTDNNLTVTAQMVRNETGRWQLMFSGISSKVQAIALNFYEWDYFYDWGPFDEPDMGYPFSIETDIPVSSLTNGIYVIPDLLMVNALVNGVYFNTGGGWDMELSPAVMVQPIAANGTYGNQIMAGLPPNDEPAFADGRQCLKQNLLFALRAATISQPNTSLGQTNYVESSIFQWTWMWKGYGGNNFGPWYLEMYDLLPFANNYNLHQSLYDPTYQGPSSFVWQQTDLATTPAPAVLGVGDPYWISQPISISPGGVSIDPGTGLPIYTSPTISISPDLAAYTNNGNLYLESGINNLFGLPFEAALVNLGGTYWYWNGSQEVEGYNPPITIAPGGFTAITNVSCFYSQTADPDLQLVNYYFAPVATQGTAVLGDNTPYQPCPLPTLTGFAVTNQTGVVIASVGSPIVIGGWAKYSIQNGNPNKFAYLGQYYLTNAFVVTNGIVTTNTTGVVSPYGDFFPTQPGVVAMVTMPDIDPPYQQGTGVVQIISLNADANHDGTMDFSYSGPDQTSPSRPFRFWANDSQDDGDYGGNGVPGQGARGNAMRQNGMHQYVIQGRRDLVNFFPVYLNIGSLFQSNALSAGISATDTNWQFVLSQADGVLRFAYTSLTPTNYMNFLRDTNVSGNLAYWSGNLYNYAPLTTITPAGVALTNTFIGGIATNNEGIILVEAAAPTTQPLILTIYHGTNQIAQTQLYLSISGVEQMFRYKNLLIGAATNQTGLLPDRLTDASVPNEPDTIDKNVVFVHGYNVDSPHARGWFADIYKRLYWSGCHAKFYGVNWYGNDSQIGTTTPNYQVNVVHAFQTAPLLANFIATLNGPTVAMAHSLGNMVTLSAMNDYGAPISQYFMVDAAVPMEAIDDSTPINTNMVYSTSSAPWLNYATGFWASKWFNVWPSSDARNTLTWNNRLGNFGGTTLYNFYSSGEDVLRTSVGAPPPNLFSLVFSEIQQYLQGDSGKFAWAWQEKLKGQMSSLLGNSILSSDHGGWQLNNTLGSGYVYFVNGLRTNIPPAVITNSVLQTNAFFDMSFDTAMFTNGPSGSAYAQTNRNRILSDAIPALTLPIGANPVTGLGIVALNFDMQLNENGWPAGRPPLQAGQPAAGEWHHSDVRVVAYTFTYQLFNQMVTTGNLK